MKFHVDTEKITNTVKTNLKYLPAVIIFIISVTFIVLTYLALANRVDSRLVAEGEEKIRSLDIRFNLKLLSELGSTKTPAQLGTAGGRDPFSGF